jgi:uncharacterized surface protein with fasciclin (FAS1) repeats
MKTLISLRLLVASATCFAAPVIAANNSENAPNQNQQPAYNSRNFQDCKGPGCQNNSGQKQAWQNNQDQQQAWNRQGEQQDWQGSQDAQGLGRQGNPDQQNWQNSQGQRWQDNSNQGSSYYKTSQDAKDSNSAYMINDGNPKASNVNIVETITAEPNLSTFVKALKAADLDKFLKGSGPYTVFAPNDSAFAKLPANTLSDLLKPENKDKLIAIIKYHILPIKISTDEIKSDKLNTLNGKKLDLKVKDDEITVNNAKILQGVWETSNGNVLELDTVMMPNS